MRLLPDGEVKPWLRVVYTILPRRITPILHGQKMGLAAKFSGASVNTVVLGTVVKPVLL